MKRVYIDRNGEIFEGLEADAVEIVEDNLRDAGYFEAVEKETKGGNIMNRLFKKSGKTKLVTINKEEGKIKRKAKVIKEITVMGVKGALADPLTYATSGSIGLQQGLKYKGDFKAGGKAGLTTVAVIAGVNVAGNIIANMDVIKEA